MNEKECSESKAAIQNKIYRHCLFIVGFVVLIDAFCVDNQIYLAEGMWGHILLIVFTCTLLYAEGLLKGVIDFQENGVKRVCIFFGLIGFTLTIWGIIDIIIKGTGFGNFLLPKTIAEVLTALCWLSIGIIYWYKIQKHKKAR